MGTLDSSERRRKFRELTIFHRYYQNYFTSAVSKIMQFTKYNLQSASSNRKGVNLKRSICKTSLLWNQLSECVSDNFAQVRKSQLSEVILYFISLFCLSSVSLNSSCYRSIYINFNISLVFTFDILILDFYFFSPCFLGLFYKTRIIKFCFKNKYIDRN